MFTGLVEAIGIVSALIPLDQTSSGGSGTSLAISKCASILSDAKSGDSISVNGTCLTITEYSNTPHSSQEPWFKVGISPETLRRTNLGSLRTGDPVNLERSVAAGQRMGGHFVQGHVDTVAKIVSITQDGNSLVFRLRPRPVEEEQKQGEGAAGSGTALKYIVEKGYVALDGASLTITKVKDPQRQKEGEVAEGEKDGWFEVMMIAYTRDRVVMGSKHVGDEVNVELDMVGKYVEKSVRGHLEGLNLKADEGGSGIIGRSLSVAGLISC